MDQQFTHPFAGSHRIGGSHGFVCGNQGETLNASFMSRMNDGLGGTEIVGNSCADVGFDERHMLVGCRMKDGLHMMISTYLCQSCGVRDVAKYGQDSECCMLPPKFFFDCVESIFI